MILTRYASLRMAGHLFNLRMDPNQQPVGEAAINERDAMIVECFRFGPPYLDVEMNHNQIVERCVSVYHP